MFKNTVKRQSTEQSKLMWKLKEDNINFAITWRIMRVNSYSDISENAILVLGKSTSSYTDQIFVHLMKEEKFCPLVFL